MPDPTPEQFIATARKRFEQDDAEEKDLRADFCEDLRMECGEQ